MRLVSNEIKLNPPDLATENGDDQPGDKPAMPEQAPGQIGPFAVPKAVEDAAKNPEPKPEDKPGASSDVGGDLGDLLGANDTPAEGKPEDGQAPEPGENKPGGLPEALGNVQPPIRPQDNPRAAQPTVDPNSPEGKKIEAARQSLEASGMPPAEVQRTLDNVFGGAQEPYTPPPGDPMPKPGFGDGVGDAWRATEEGVHDLTGQNGFENFKDAWKDLGSSVVETVKDPYGTLVRGIGEEFEHATENPTHWLGEKAFQAGATAATAPFGGEAALARGALDDVARPGVPHEVIDSPGHNPAPVAETPSLHVDTGPPAHLPPADPGLNHVNIDSGGTGAWNPELNNPAPNTQYTVDNQYQFTTDSHGRSTSVEGQLALDAPSDRNGYQQRIAGGEDRLPGDHGGHIIGSQFGGPGEAINLTAMRDTLNAFGPRDYYNLENEWKSLMQQGHSVEVKVEIDYVGESRRPDSYSVETYVDGKLYHTRDFEN